MRQIRAEARRAGLPPGIALSSFARGARIQAAPRRAADAKSEARGISGSSGDFIMRKIMLAAAVAASALSLAACGETAKEADDVAGAMAEDADKMGEDMEAMGEEMGEEMEAMGEDAMKATEATADEVNAAAEKAAADAEKMMESE